MALLEPWAFWHGHSWWSKAQGSFERWKQSLLRLKCKVGVKLSGSHVQAGQGLLETTLLRFTKKPASAATGLQPVQFSHHIPKHVVFFFIEHEPF